MPASAKFTWDVPSNFNFARDVIDRLASEDRLGLVALAADGSRHEFRFPEIADQIARWAAVFRDAGIGKGDRVIVIMPKVPEWLFAMIALLRLGAVSIPGAEQLRAKDVIFRANHAQAQAIVAHPTVVAEMDLVRADAPTIKTWLVSGQSASLPGWTALGPLVAAAKPFDGNPTNRDDQAFIIYTSGTTKDPKGVVHAVAYTYATRMQAERWYDLRKDDLVWCTAGTGWAKSLWNVLLGPWSCGSTLVLDEGDSTPQCMDRIRDLG